MMRYRIVHHTYYNFSTPVALGPHVLRLRPREGHDLQIESSRLKIEPDAELRWYRDAEDNCVATAIFASATRYQLAIISEICVRQYADSGGNRQRMVSESRWPAAYRQDERDSLNVYRPISSPGEAGQQLLGHLMGRSRPVPGDSIHETLTQIGDRIRETFSYAPRVASGVQTVEETVRRGSGACRDLAAVFVECARRLGLAARYVSGYLSRTHGSFDDLGATHAWAEVYVPGSGWTGFDPTNAGGVGADHIAVCVASEPDRAAPVAGSFVGPGPARLDVGVWVTPLAEPCPTGFDGNVIAAFPPR